MSIEKNQEQIKVEITREEISDIKRDVGTIKENMHEMYIALMGSNLTKDGGLVSRVIDGEIQIEKLNLRIRDLENKENKNSLYLKIIWAAGGVIVTTIVISLINHFFK